MAHGHPAVRVPTRLTPAPRNALHRAVWLALLGAMPGSAGAGQLEPPGPPAPTMKTLQQIEPRVPIESLPVTIAQPGSYYLTGSLTGVAGQDGVTITAGDVTLDLMGFSLVGAGSASGVAVGSGLQGVSVRNGTIRSWSVGVAGSTATGLRLADLHVSSNAISGILGGSDTLVTRCVARQNGDRGIQITSGVVDSSNASFNNIGITVTDGAILGSTALNNTTGIVALRSVVRDSVASSNTGDGLLVSAGKVLDSVARSNGADGIEALGDSIVQGNVCASNGTTGTGAGIHSTGDKNHIEGNNVMNNDVGIDTNDIGVENNVVVRNTASCNTSNYDSGANNQIGTIGSLATIGTNPWGNLSMTGFCP